MRPDENQSIPPMMSPSNHPTDDTHARTDNATEAANVVRGQLDHIYASDPQTTVQVPVTMHESTTSGLENIQYTHQENEVANPYKRTHDEAHHQIDAGMWQKYHSAWQNYYQQYYERYYVGQVHEAKRSLESQAGTSSRDDQPLSNEEAMYDLRSKLRQQISARASKVRKSRHFMPILASAMVMLIFVFLQYNRVIFASVEAYIAPGTLESSALIVDPSVTTEVSADPKLIIPSINVEVPIIWDANAADQNSLNAAMDKGVAWFNINGASARPGEVGNFVLSGHSSNDWLDQGDFKFIFARLEQLNEEDTIYVNYNSTRYTYQVTSKQVVKPTDVSALTQDTTKPIMTLVTCTPLGTALNRLLVFAEQVSPDPAKAATSTSSTAPTSTNQMPSNSPTFFERLFGIGN